MKATEVLTTTQV